MNNNSIVFKNLLQSRDIIFEEIIEDKAHLFTIDQTIKNGPRVRSVVEFAEESSNAVIVLVNYVTIQNPSKRDYTLQLLNELNAAYSFNKFIMDKEGHVTISVYLSVKKNFDAEQLLLLLIYAITAAEEEYPKFMKLMWA
jgi:hypothetical protein